MDKPKPNIEFYFYIILIIFFGWQLILALTSVLQFFQDILIIIFLGWFVYFILNPAVKFLVKQKIPRGLSVLIMFLVLIGLIAISLAILIPHLAAQLMLLNENLPTFTQNAETFITGFLQRFKIINISKLDTLLNTYGGQLVSFSSALISNWLAILSATVNVTLNIIMILLIGVFFLIDEKKIYDYIKKIIPQSYHDEFTLLNKKIHTSFGGFIRGQLILGIVNGICTWFVLMVLGVNLSLLVGILAAIAMFIPFFNGFIGFVPGVAITLLVRPNYGWWFLLFYLLFIRLNLMSFLPSSWEIAWVCIRLWLS